MAKNSKQSKRKSSSTSKLMDTWSVQCGECSKWRVIPTEKEYEEIRSKFMEDPFVCSKRPGVSCDNPADMEYDNSRTWVIDKPNIPKTPSGFKRTMVMRSDFSKMDCYYETPSPNKKRLRALPDVSKWLDQNPEYKKEISLSDFSFTGPKIMKDTVPARVSKKVLLN